MKTCVCSLLVGPVLTLSPVMAQQQTAPSPEMQKLLSAMSGTWTCHFDYAPSEHHPNGSTGEGEATFRPGPGGLSMLEDEKANEPDGELVGMSVTWWDVKAHGYRAIWCSNKIPGGCIVMSRLAKWEGGDFALGDEFTRDGKKLIFREVVSNITANSFTQTLSQGEAGKELKTILTIHATRKDAATQK